MSKNAPPTLVDIGTLAIQHEASRARRAKARSALSRERRKWMEEDRNFWDEEESRGEEGYQDMVDSLAEREAANALYRRTSSNLRRAIKKATAK